jgi:hypothetical protein
MVLTPIESPAKNGPQGAAADGAQQGHANVTAIREHLGSGPSTAPELARVCGFSDVTARNHLRRLALDGDIEKVGKRWRLTPKGMAIAGPIVCPSDLDRVLALLPSEPHRAIVRLARDAVLVRYALSGQGGIGWPSFALWGAPGGLKTGIARMLGRLFGLEDHDHVVLATDRGRSDLLGRRVGDGKGGFRWEPAPRLSLPVLTIDELDKAKSDAGRETPLRLLQGDSLISWEGSTFTMRATPIVTFNAGSDPRDVLAPDRLRRMVMVDVTGLASETECRKAARALFDVGSIPILDLARLAPSAEPITDDVAGFFDEALPEYLTPEAQRIYPGHALSLIVAGRAVFEGIDIEQAATAIGFDYLTTAQTWGGTTPRVIAAYARRYGLVAPEPVTEIEALAVDIDERSEAVELAEIKAVGRQAVADELADLGKPTDEEGIRLVAAFKEVARQLGATKSIAEIERVDAVFAGLYERADQRAAQIAGRRAMAAPGSRPAGSLPAGSQRRAVAPDRLAMLLQLRDAGHKDAPAKVLGRLGLVVEDPFPPGTDSPLGRRYRGALPESVGAVVFDADDWTEAAVTGILGLAIAAEKAARPVAGTTIMRALGRP